MTGTISPFGVCVAMPMWTRAVAGDHVRIVVIGRVEHRPFGERPAIAVIRNGSSVSLGLEPRSRFIIARVSSSAVTSIFLDQGEMRDAALRLLHVLGDLAAQADDLDRLVLPARRRRARETLPPL